MSENYTNMTLLTCWVAWHWTWRIFTRMYITKINFSRCYIARETLEMQPKKAWTGQPIGQRNICPRMCHDPVGHTNNSTITTCTDGATEHRGDEGLGVIRVSEHLFVSALSYKKQRWQELELPCRTVVSKRYSVGQTGQPRTLWRRGATRKQQETRQRWRWSTIPRVMMVTFHLSNERLIFTSEEVPAWEEVFASTAELCSVDFSLSSLLWNHEIAVTFCVLCTCGNCYSFLWYWPVCADTFFCDRRLTEGSRYRD